MCDLVRHLSVELKCDTVENPIHEHETNGTTVSTGWRCEIVHERIYFSDLGGRRFDFSFLCCPVREAGKSMFCMELFQGNN